MKELGRLLVVAGALVAVLGALVMIAGRIPWFGKLPGDIDWSSGRARVFVPIVSMIVLSLALTVVVNLILWLFRRGS